MDLKDLQTPLIGALGLGAAASAGFVAGYIVGRDPELARKLTGALASGLTRTQVALAETWENLGDLWAEARDEAREQVEAERFAEQPDEVVVEEAEVSEAAAKKTTPRARKKKQAPRRARPAKSASRATRARKTSRAKKKAA